MEILTFCQENNVELLQEALINGADTNVRDGRGQTGLHIVAIRGGAEAMAMLLDAGADPTLTDANGNTPLHMCGHKETVALLVKSGAKVLARNYRGDTPITLMKRRGVSKDVINTVETEGRFENQETFPQSVHLQVHQQQQRIDCVMNIWYEFCNDIGQWRLAILLIFTLCLSLYVAYTITGYSNIVDTRIPVKIQSQNRIEL